MTSKIAHEIRVGAIVATIRQTRRRKAVQHQISVHRLFVSDAKWVKSSLFSGKDLPQVRYVLDLAHTWIVEQASLNENNLDTDR